MIKMINAKNKENRVIGQNQKIKTYNSNNFKKVVEKKVALNTRALRPVDNGVRGAKKTDIKQENKVKKIKTFHDDAPQVKSAENLPISDEVAKLEHTTIISKGEATESCNLLHALEYKEDIWQYLNDLEKIHSYPKSKYMLKQSDLSWNTRSILVDWLASVAEEYKLCNQTFHLAVNYIDRFLCQVAVVRTKFQLVGAAAMLLAGKMEEIYPINLAEWAYLTADAFTPRQIKKMEHLVARALKLNMQPPTMCTFIEHFCQEHKIDSKTMNLAMYISELVLLEGEDYLNFLPSHLAASSIALARYCLSGVHPWPKKFEEHSGYSLKQLSPVVQKQQKTLLDSPLKNEQSIQKKYTSDKYHKVALMKPKKLVLENFEEE